MRKVCFVLLMFICISICRCALRSNEVFIANRIYHLAFTEASGTRFRKLRNLFIAPKWTPRDVTEELKQRLVNDIHFSNRPEIEAAFAASKAWYICALGYIDTTAHSTTLPPNLQPYVDDTKQFQVRSVELMKGERRVMYVNHYGENLLYDYDFNDRVVALKYNKRMFGAMFFRHHVGFSATSCRYKVQKVSENGQLWYRFHFPEDAIGQASMADVRNLPDESQIPPAYTETSRPGDIQRNHPPPDTPRENNSPAVEYNLPAGSISPAEQDIDQPAQQVNNPPPPINPPAYSPRVNNVTPVDHYFPRGNIQPPQHPPLAYSPREARANNPFEVDEDYPRADDIQRENRANNPPKVDEDNPRADVIQRENRANNPPEVDEDNPRKDDIQRENRANNPPEVDEDNPRADDIQRENRANNPPEVDEDNLQAYY